MIHKLVDFVKLLEVHIHNVHGMQCKECKNQKLSTGTVAAHHSLVDVTEKNEILGSFTF